MPHPRDADPPKRIACTAGNRDRNTFLQIMKGNGIIDLEEYGRLIASCYGETPSLEVRDFLKEK